MLHPLVRLSVGLCLLDGKVSVTNVLPVEWEQAISQGFALQKKLAVQDVNCTRCKEAFRHPDILPLSDLPLEKWGTNEDAPVSTVPVGSLFCATAKAGGDPELIKLTWKCNEDDASYNAREDPAPCLPAEELQDLLQSGLLDRLAPERLSLFEVTNMIPASSISASKLLSLQSEVRRDESFIVSGKSGSGKTHTALILSAMSFFIAERHVVYLDCVALKSLRRMVDILDAIRDAIEEAGATKSILVLDDLDELVVQDHFEASVGSGTQVQQPNWGEMEQSKLIRDHVRHLLQMMDHAPPIIITCQDADVVSTILPAVSRHTYVSLPLLDPNERLELLLDRLKVHGSHGHEDWEDGLRHVLSCLDFEGYSRSYLPVDLCTLASRIDKSASAHDWDPEKLRDTVGNEMERFVPVSRSAASLENVASKATWDDVGGLFQTKQDLLDAVFRPAMYRRIYEKSKVRLPRGLLLFGPPGCGKSFVVPALARHCRLPLIMCRGPELLDRYIGGSEAKVRELFSRAFLAAPCILFLDEFDALAPKRGSDSTGVTDRGK